MTVLDHTPHTGYAFRMHRRHQIITVGGIDAVLRVADALRALGYPVRDFTLEVRDGVPYGSVTCTLSLTNIEAAELAAVLGRIDGVVAVEPC